MKTLWTVKTTEVSTDPHKYMAVAIFGCHAATYIGDEQETRSMVKTVAVKELKAKCKREGIYL